MTEYKIIDRELTDRQEELIFNALEHYREELKDIEVYSEEHKKQLAKDITQIEKLEEIRENIMKITVTFKEIVKK